MRDLRIDFFRGVALIGITWNHTVPSKIVVNEWGHFQLDTNFFFNFADVFIFISGVVCAIAFGSKLSRFGRRRMILSVGDRILQIVVYNAIACCVCILIVYAFGLAGVFALHHYLEAGFIDSFLGSVLQYNAIPYFNILNMYVIFLALFPLFLIFYKKWKLSIFLSFAIYLASQVYYYSTEIVRQPYFFGSIFSWQFLFFLGATIGIEREKIKAWLDINRFIPFLAFSYLFLGVYLSEMKYAYFYFSDKHYLGLFRILDILAAAYLVVTFLENKKFTELDFLSPIVALGRNSLPVFSFSLVLCYLASLLAELLIESRIEYFALLFVELMALYLIGWALCLWPRFEKIVSLKSVGLSMFLGRGRDNDTPHGASR